MKLASERAVVVFTLSSCCMCHAVRSLMSNLGVNAVVHELDKDPSGKEMERALLKMLGVGGPPLPAVFIGGRLVGGANNVMSLHLSGKLVPMLKSAGECSVACYPCS
jgi:glutaredoxin 3